jgi:hypothetical protein
LKYYNLKPVCGKKRQRLFEEMKLEIFVAIISNCHMNRVMKWKQNHPKKEENLI